MSCSAAPRIAATSAGDGSGRCSALLGTSCKRLRTAPFFGPGVRRSTCPFGAEAASPRRLLVSIRFRIARIFGRRDGNSPRRRLFPRTRAGAAVRINAGRKVRRPAKGGPLLKRQSRPVQIATDVDRRHLRQVLRTRSAFSEIVGSTPAQYATRGGRRFQTGDEHDHTVKSERCRNDVALVERAAVTAAGSGGGAAIGNGNGKRRPQAHQRQKGEPFAGWRNEHGEPELQWSMSR